MAGIATAADYVIVGAGTSGCVLAHRLSADPGCSVLLIEAGGADRHPYIHVPAGFLRMLDHPTVTWRYRTDPHPDTAGREIVFPLGRGLGGSTQINGLLYVRPFPSDIDAWESLGAPGWNFERCLPYFRRSESWLDGAHRRRGADGPVQVTRVAGLPEICGLVVRAGEEAGLQFVGDPNAEDPRPSVWYYQQTRDRRLRSSAARAYLRPALRRKNLRVLSGAQATRLELEGRTIRAVRARTGRGAPLEIRARREVILCAGVAGTPKILELSGIGDPAVLDNAGIPCQLALPGVGKNFQDHYVARLCFRVRGAGTANERSHGLALLREMLRFVVRGTGLLTYSAAAVGGFASTRPGLPDVQYVFAPGSFKDGRIGELEDEPGVSCGCWQMRPASRGEIHVRSADPGAPPVIAPRYLSHELDRRTLVEGLKIARRVFAQPAIAPCIVAETTPGPAAGPDERLLDYVRANGSTVYHAVGTCRMGSDEESVVDASLRVRGLDNLRIADGSVMPRVTSTNTNATVLMIAERAADLISSRLP